LSTAELVDHAKVEMLVVSTSLLMKKVFLTLLVNNTLLKMAMENALPKKNARTAPGHHAQRVKIARTNVGPLLTNLIMLLTTTVSEVPPR
jgi:hypothetical protein